MSAPIIWIVLPLLISVVLMSLVSRERLVWVTGLIISGLLVIIAVFQPIGNVIKAGPVSFSFSASLNIFGRSFLLENSDRFALALIYLILFLFIGSSRGVNVPIKTIPLSLAIGGLLTAALAVQPFLYAAILVELAVLLMIPLVTRKDILTGKGILNFLVYQTLAMPFILFAGWILGGIEASPSDPARLNQAAIFLSIGFSFWLAVFPFHSWVPQFAQDVHPFHAGLIFTLLPIVTLIIMVDYISGLVWLRESAYISPALRYVGIIMIVTGGLWSLVERKSRRIIGYAALFETGFALLAVSTLTFKSTELLFLSFVPRMFAMILLSYSMSVITGDDASTELENLTGAIRKFPMASVAMLVSLFSISGFPALASFPIKIAIISGIGSQDMTALNWLLVGVVVVWISVTRIMFLFTRPTTLSLKVNENITQFIFMAAGVFILILMGLFPQIYTTLIDNLLVDLQILQ